MEAPLFEPRGGIVGIGDLDRPVGVHYAAAEESDAGSAPPAGDLACELLAPDDEEPGQRDRVPQRELLVWCRAADAHERTVGEPLAPPLEEPLSIPPYERPGALA